MNPIFLLFALFDGLQRLACRWRESRRLERDMRELASMSQHELRDIGLSHASMAAAARFVTHCE